jgi:hypothetical protein
MTPNHLFRLPAFADQDLHRWRLGFLRATPLRSKAFSPPPLKVIEHFVRAQIADPIKGIGNYSARRATPCEFQDRSISTLGNATISPPAARRKSEDPAGQNHWPRHANGAINREPAVAARGIATQALEHPVISADGMALPALTLNEVDGVRAIMPQIKREWSDQVIIVEPLKARH